MSIAKQGKVITFNPAAKGAREPIEQAFEKRFWDNVRADLSNVVKLFLMEVHGFTASSEDYANDLIAFRGIQGESPSQTKDDVQKAFAYATIGHKEAMSKAFANQTRLWKEGEIRPGQPHYAIAVQEAVLNDTSEVLDFFVENWLLTVGGIEDIASKAVRASEEILISVFVEALYDLMKIDGANLRNKIEESANEKLSDIYVTPNFKISPTEVIAFKPKPQ